MKKYISYLVFLFLVSCSSFNAIIEDPYGRVIPNPHYTLQVTGKPLYITFYYTAYENIKDVDGTVIGRPSFMELFGNHKINYTRYDGISLTIEVKNPNKIEYSLYELIKVNETQSGDELNKSNLVYRQFVYKLPYGKEVRYVDHLISFRINNEEVIRIGNFRYIINH